MSLVLESGYTSINKRGEELCGDKVEKITNGDFTTLVLADGLGSGVKANILSTLTSKILSTMIASGIEIDECIETIIQTLPVCKERQMAYSTFTAANVNKEGNGYLFEFDNPEAIYYHDGKCGNFDRIEKNILGKKVFVTKLNLVENDIIIIFSDGVIHAGIGNILNLGWQRDNVCEYLDKVVTNDMSGRCVANLLASECNDLYFGEAGDDTTVAAIKIRNELKVNIMVGPPVDMTKDDFYVERFLEGDSKKVVCGGTSSQIVSRYLGEKVTTDCDYQGSDLPPIGYIKGIDLTTEGVLTLRKLLYLSEKYVSNSDLSPKYYTKKDGDSLLADMLFEKATSITFYVGQGINKAHQGQPIDITMKLKLVESLTNNLKKMGKDVEVNYD